MQGVSGGGWGGCVGRPLRARRQARCARAAEWSAVGTHVVSQVDGDEGQEAGVSGAVGVRGGGGPIVEANHDGCRGGEQHEQPAPPPPWRQAVAGGAPRSRAVGVREQPEQVRRGEVEGKVGRGVVQGQVRLERGIEARRQVEPRDGPRDGGGGAGVRLAPVEQRPRAAGAERAEVDGGGERDAQRDARALGRDALREEEGGAVEEQR